MRFRDLFESPIDNFQVIEPPSPDDLDAVLKSRSFSPQDHAIVTRDKAIRKIRNAFTKTPFVFDFYIVMNDVISHIGKNARLNTMWSPESLSEIVGHPLDTTGKISVVISNNITGANRKPLTAWTLAHRTAHHFQLFSEKTKVSNWAEHVFWDALSGVWQKAFPNWGYWKSTNNVVFPVAGVLNASTGHRLARIETAANNFVNTLLTMKSAREHLISNSLDVFPEMFAQYLLTGRVRFNRVAQWDRDKILREIPWVTYSKVNDLETLDERVQDVDQAIADLETFVNDKIEDLLKRMVGHVVGW